MIVIKVILLELLFSVLNLYEVRKLCYVTKDYILNLSKKLWKCILEGESKEAW